MADAAALPGLEHLNGLVRSVIQHHGRAAANVYAGSAPTLMRALFSDRERPLFGQARMLNLGIQALLRDWGARNKAEGDDTAPADGRLLDQYRIGWFHELNRQLGDTLEPAAFVERMRGDVARMHDLAAELLAHARRRHPDIDGGSLDMLLDGHPAPAQPLLDAAWYAETAPADAIA